MAVTVVGVDKSRFKTVTCPNCASILQYLPIDVQRTTVSCCGELDTVKVIACPTCSYQIVVS